MTVRVIGPWCESCSRLPALSNGLCAVCNRTIGTPPEPQQITSVNDPGFEAALRAWRTGAS